MRIAGVVFHSMLLTGLTVGSIRAQGPDFADAIGKLSLTNSHCLYLKDMATGGTLFSDDPERIGTEPVPVGSIIKIFSIIAKYRNHPVDERETHVCRGYGPGISDLSKCWLKDGHGKLSLLNAIAFSCNSYFYGFVQDIDFPLFMRTLRDWGVYSGTENRGKTAFNRSDQIRAMIGKMNVIKIRPLDLMDACAKLFGPSGRPDRRALPSDVREILTDGMRAAYEYGTASGARKRLGMAESLDILCKTGTGVFEEDDKVYFYRTNGAFLGVLDGRYLVLVLAKDSTGADSASLLGLAVFRELVRSGRGGQE